MLEVLPLLSQVVTAAGIVFLASLCLLASWHKYSDLSEFRKIVEAYEILPLPMTSAAVWCLPAFELGCGIAILVPSTSSVASLAISGLFALYGIAMYSTILRGKVLEDCGCGGPARVKGQAQVLSAWHIIRNIVLVGLASWLASTNASVLQIVDLRTWLLIIPVSALGILLYWVADTLAANHSLMKGRHG